jgi:cytochrome c553
MSAAAKGKKKSPEHIAKIAELAAHYSPRKITHGTNS